tara:strand:+ start:251 stop:511 length:261 start_codon:yes stop_codon:yes gene_type:complete
MNYIPINADRMALTDLLKIVDTLTITGIHTHDIEQREWQITAMCPGTSKGYISSGPSIEDAVNEWFKLSGVERPIPDSFQEIRFSN